MFNILFWFSKVKKYIYPIIGWLLIIIGLTVLLSSCSPVKKLERLQRKNPYLFENIKDTVVIKDTINIEIPEKRIDTSVFYKTLYDTVTIHKNGIETKVWLTNTDTVYIQTKAEPLHIKVPYQKKVLVNKYAPLPVPKTNHLKKILYWLIPIAVGSFILWLYYRKKR